MYHNKFASHKLILSALFVLGASLPAQSQTLTDLYNTGVNSSGTSLASNGLVDTHWTNGAAGTAFTTSNGAYFSYADAGYITIDGTGGDGSYTTTFNTTFTLPTNTILSTVSIAGNYGIDDSLEDILINGHSTGLSNHTVGNFSIANHFALPTGFYQTGTNTLSVVWTDAGGPGAMAVEFTSKSFRTSAVPEPGTVTQLVGMGIVGAGFLARRRRAVRLTV